MDPALIAQEDITMVFCMLNEVRGSDITAFSESSRVGMDIINLCRNMQELNRPMLVVGGADAVFGSTTTPRGTRWSIRWCSLVVDWIPRPSAVRAT